MTQNFPAKIAFNKPTKERLRGTSANHSRFFVDAAERITGSILDVGCGTGENSLFFADRGHKVTGIDFLEHPISEVRWGDQSDEEMMIGFFDTIQADKPANKVADGN